MRRIRVCVILADGGDSMRFIIFCLLALAYIGIQEVRDYET